MVLRQICSMPVMSVPRCRFFSQLPPSSNTKSQYIKPASGLRKLIGSKLLRLYSGYDSVLRKILSPSLYHVYRVFADGTRDLYTDFKQLTALSIDLKRGRSVSDLKFKELLIYYETPKDLIRVSPTIVISSLPFANYVMFPLAYRFPRYLLSQHYWTTEQKVNFQTDELRGRVRHYDFVIQDMQNRLSLINEEGQRNECQKILEQLRAGLHPSPDQVLRIRCHFSSPLSFSLSQLCARHQSHLCQIHGLHSRTFLPSGRTARLMRHAEFMWRMDQAIMREGGPESLSPDDLHKVCFHRGLYPLDQQRTSLDDWLRQWIQISSNCNGESFSLLLHTPVLLSYNHPSNRRLILPDK